MTLWPINPYGETKLDAERVLEKSHASYVVLRYFNAVGCDPQGMLGFPYKDGSTLLPVMMRVVCGDQSELKIYGDDYPTSDGTAVRDYIHVCDLASAHIKALDYLFAGGKSTIVNVGTGRGYTVNEMCRSVEAVTGQVMSVQYAPRRQGDPAASVADVKKITEKFGWRAEFTSLDDIVKTVWDYCIEHDYYKKIA